MDKKRLAVKLNWRKTIKLDNLTIKNQEFESDIDRLDYVISNSKKFLRDRFEQARNDINFKASELSKLKGLKEAETHFIKSKREELLKEIDVEEEKCLKEYLYSNVELTNKYKKKLQYFRSSYESLIQRARNLNKVNLETLFDKSANRKDLTDEKSSIKADMEALKQELLHDLFEVKRALFLDRTVVYNKNTSQIAMRSSSLASSNELQIGNSKNNLSASNSNLSASNSNLVGINNLDMGKIIIFEYFYDDFEFYMIR